MRSRHAPNYRQPVHDPCARPVIPDMRAVRIHTHGGPEVLQVDEVPEPAPGPGDLLVRLRATSVNHRDIWIRRGHPHPAYHVDLPAVLGHRRLRRRRRGRPEGSTAFAPETASRRTRTCSAARAGTACAGEFQLCPASASTTAPMQSSSSCRPRFAVSRRPVGARRVRRRLPEHVHHGLADARRQGGRLDAADTVFVWAGTSGLGQRRDRDREARRARRVITSAGTRRSARCCADARRRPGTRPPRARPRRRACST